MSRKNLLKKDFFLIGFIIISFLLLINITIFKIYWIPSDSMREALHEDDFVYVFQLPYLLNYGEPEYGQILIFKYPLQEDYDYVKRLLGRPGDTVYIKENKFFRNNELIEEKYLADDLELPDFGPVMVPENSYFFLGDNRNHSIDSREWGFVDYSLIKGRVLSIIWPLERAGGLK